MGCGTSWPDYGLLYGSRLYEVSSQTPESALVTINSLVRIYLSEAAVATSVNMPSNINNRKMFHWDLLERGFHFLLIEVSVLIEVVYKWLGSAVIAQCLVLIGVEIKRGRGWRCPLWWASLRWVEDYKDLADNCDTYRRGRFQIHMGLLGFRFQLGHFLAEVVFGKPFNF